jgi:Tol biopolymer transport system component
MLRAVFLAALVAALFPATATAADDGLIAFTVAEAGIDVVGPDGSGRRPLVRESGAYSPDWSPDGRRLVYSAGEIRVFDGSRTVGLGVSGGAPAWSPDGTRIAFHSGGDIHVARVTQNLEVLGVDRVIAGRAPAWSPDGTRLAYVDLYGDLYVVDAGGGVPERLAPGLAAEDPDWSPDGRRIAFASGAGIWAVEIGGTSQRLVESGSQPAWSPSGSRLAFASSGDVRVVDLASGALATLAGGPGSETAPTWAGAAAPPPTVYGPGVEARHVGRIAFVRGGEIFAMNPGGGDVRRLTWNAVVDGEPAWAPPVPGLPARLAFTRSGRIQVMRADGSDVRTLTRSPGLHRSPAWSPDGRAIAFTRIPPGEAAQVWIAEVNGGGERRVSPEGAAAYANPSWSPDGSQLAFERVDTSVLIPPNLPAITYNYLGPDGQDRVRETRVIGLGFCTLGLVTRAVTCRDSANQELAPVWGSGQEHAFERHVYVANGVETPHFAVVRRGLWTTHLMEDLRYESHRFVYDTPIPARVHDPADPSLAPDGTGVVVAAREHVGDELRIIVVRAWRPLGGSLNSPIDATAFPLVRGTQPSWEARRARLPARGDGAFDRRTRVRARLRRGRLTLFNGNRFVVAARVGRRELRLPPGSTRRVRARSRRVRLEDAAGHRRTIRARSLSA